VCALSSQATFWYFIPSNYWSDNSSYTVQSNAYDRANNNTLSGVMYFVYDTSAPVSSVNLPPNNGDEVQSLSQISGTARDLQLNGLGTMKEVTIRIKCIGGTDPKYNQYWTGSSWTATVNTWSTTTLVLETPPRWYRNTPSDLSSEFWFWGREYSVEPRGEDGAGNFETAYSTRTFFFKPPLPATVVTTPKNNSFYNNIALINGNANDQVVSLTIQIERLFAPDGKRYYSNYSSTWVVVSTWCPVNFSLPPNWDYNTPLYWESNSSYTVRSKGFNQWGTEETNIGPTYNNENTFWCDRDNPESSVKLPVLGEYYNESLSTLSGTASDNLAGIKRVQVSIWRTVPDTKYWNIVNSSWTDLPSWQWNSTSTFVGSLWTVSLPTNPFTDGVQYFVKCRAMDNADNELESSVNNFRYDITKPTASVTIPPAGSVLSTTSIPAYKSLTTLKGDYWDDTNQPRTTNIKIQRLYPTPVKFFDGNGGWFDEVWITSHTDGTPLAVYGSSWAYTANFGWQSGGKYLVISKAQDRALNWQEIFVQGTSSNTFIYDIDYPQSWVSYPQTQYVSSVSYIAGTAQDYPLGPWYSVGLSTTDAQIKVLIKDITVDKYWRGTIWSDSIVSTPTAKPEPPSASTLDAWKYDGITNSDWTSDHEYKIMTMGVDGLQTEEPVNVKWTLYYDTTPPQSFIPSS